MSAVREESNADKSAWPLLRSERNWGPFRLGVALATAAAATWCYLIGEYTGYYLNFFQGGLALTAGSMIGMQPFGTSAPLRDVMRHFGFTATAVAEAARRQIARQAG